MFQKRQRREECFTDRLTGNERKEIASPADDMTTPGLSEAAPRTSASASAPGRLDFLGGVSDYSGATVLQAAISLETKVTVTEIRGSRGEGEEEKRLLEVSSEQFGEHVGIDLRKLERAGKESFRSVRRYLSAASAPQWVYYAAGCLVCLCIQVDKYPQTSVRMHIASQVPPGQGVSSSASLEIAIIRALMAFMNVEDCLEDMEIAKLAQRAENEVVGASCGKFIPLLSSLISKTTKLNE